MAPHGRALTTGAELQRANFGTYDGGSVQACRGGTVSQPPGKAERGRCRCIEVSRQVQLRCLFGDVRSSSLRDCSCVNEGKRGASRSITPSGVSLHSIFRSSNSTGYSIVFHRYDTLTMFSGPHQTFRMYPGFTQSTQKSLSAIPRAKRAS